MNIALLGCGQVGLAVYRKLLQLAPALQVCGVAVRSPEKHGETVAKEHLRDDAGALATDSEGIVVELIGGVQTALGAVRDALRQGNHVVTANKELVAAHGDELESLAERRGVKFLFSAAVGGSVPLIELIRARVAAGGAIKSITGIFNGTTNYILDQLHQGQDLRNALSMAREAGLCELDPRDDLNGNDAQRKLMVVAKQAWGHKTKVLVQSTSGVNELTRDLCAAAETAACRLRQVGRISIENQRARGSVGLELIDENTFLGASKMEENRFELSFDDGTVERIHGLGAGPSPTTQAVLGDILEICRLVAKGQETAPVKGIRA